MSPSRASLMMLFCCTRTHLWPCALCPLSSFPPPSLPTSSLPSQVPEGASLAMSMKDKKENTLGRGTSPSNAHTPSPCHPHLDNYGHSLDQRKQRMLSWSWTRYTHVNTHETTHPPLHKRHSGHLNTLVPHKSHNILSLELCYHFIQDSFSML